MDEAEQRYPSRDVSAVNRGFYRRHGRSDIESASRDDHQKAVAREAYDRRAFAFIRPSDLL